MAARNVVFIHGLWLHATSWSPWVDRFREAGLQEALDLLEQVAITLR